MPRARESSWAICSSLRTSAQGPEGHRRACASLGGLATSSVDSRFDALHATGVTELVGREEELELLLRRWSKAKTGEGQVVLLSGEPGIGKSRLTAALIGTARYRATHALAILLLTAAHRQRSISDHQPDGACRWICARRYDASEARQAGCSAVSELHTTLRIAALFAELLSLPNDGRYPKLDLAPQQRRQQTFEALTTQIDSLADPTPVLMIFEDVHWIDPTSLEALGRRN